jgi:hypothetical protein
MILRNMRLIILTLFISVILLSCDTTKLGKTKSTQFDGFWRIENRDIYEGMEIEIKNTEENKFVGVITKLNDNKFVKMFMNVGDKIVTDISRKSNFQFILKERKIASELFSAYGQNTTQEYRVVFENKNQINLGKNGGKGRYIRIEESIE